MNRSIMESLASNDSHNPASETYVHVMNKPIIEPLVSNDLFDQDSEIVHTKNDALDKEILLEARNLCKSYKMGKNSVDVLLNLNLKIYKAEALCIMGSSGTGKSTLLHLLGSLDQPSSGYVFYRGQNIFDKTPDQLALFRNQHIGFVFQFHHLLKEFTALENVMLPVRIAGSSKKQASQKANDLLGELGVDHRKNHLPKELSGGEQQRVAIARALIQDPDILFADEPTGNLDSKNAQMIEDVFFKLHETKNLTLVVVTHDQKFSERFPRILNLRDGQCYDK